MRLKISRQPEGCIDGIRLDNLVVGFVYEVGTTLGCYLLAQGVAEPVDEDVPAHVPPWSETRFSIMKPDAPAAPAPTAPATSSLIAPTEHAGLPADAAPAAPPAAARKLDVASKLEPLSQAADRSRRRRKPAGRPSRRKRR